MKTKSLIISLCLIMGISLTQASAQDHDTKSVQGWFMSEYWSPVYCGGIMVDELLGGTIRVHYVVHYKDGMYQWETDQLKGEITSSTGEVFDIKEIDKTYFTDHWYVTWTYHLKGDQGTFYIGTITYSYFTGEITYGKTVCH
ncbi:MAG TPA: hypothetical protein VMV74_12565 [Bacteroidales bacterium]|nr:hypothetical protein [Bacteroidales bacterium]